MSNPAPSAAPTGPDPVKRVAAIYSLVKALGLLLGVILVSAFTAAGTVALGIWIALHVKDEYYLWLSLVITTALTLTIVIGLIVGIVIVALSRSSLAKAAFLAFFAVTYVIVGVATFRLGTEWSSVRRLTIASVVHWAFVGGISVPVAWLIGKAIKAELRRITNNPKT